MTEPSALSVVHLVRAANGPEPLRTFLHAYRSCDPGVAHLLVLACKGFDRTRLAKIQALVPRGSIVLALPDRGFDIGTYRDACLQLSSEYVCFLNSFSRPLRQDWLAALAKETMRTATGIAGATGSLEIAPHVRSNAFCMRRKLFLALVRKAPASKQEAYAIESGPGSLTRRVLDLRMKARVVGAMGTYDVSLARESCTFRWSLQEHLLVADNRTDDYARAGSDQKRALQRASWGCEMPPTSPDAASCTNGILTRPPPTVTAVIASPAAAPAIARAIVVSSTPRGASGTLSPQSMSPAPSDLAIPRPAKKDPKVLFICPIFRMYPQVISSLICQSHPHWELRLIHNGPEPDTALRRAITAYDDPRVTLESYPHETGNYGHALRIHALRALREGRLGIDADYVVITNADNYHVPTYLEYMIEGFRTQPDAVVVYCSHMVHNYVSWQQVAPIDNQQKQAELTWRAFRWGVIACKPERGYVDAAGAMVKRDVAAAIGWPGLDHSSDWTYFERIIAQYGTARWRKVDGCLLTHN